MAKLSQGILGGISGKIGNIVGSSWKGIAVIKTKPLSVANPRTAGQVAQRNSMTGIVALSVQILASVIKPLWDRAAQYMSGYNAFISENIASADEDGIIDYETVIFCKGKMAATPIQSANGDISDGDVNVVWLNDAGTGYKLATDSVYCVVVNNIRKTFTLSTAVVTRSMGSVTLDMPANSLTGDQCFAFLMFRRADGTITSQQSIKEFGAAA